MATTSTTVNAIAHYKDASGTVTTLHFKNTADNVTVDVSVNSNLPQSANYLNEILKALGSLAFANEITYDNIADGVVTTATDITTEGYIADARVVPILLEQITDIADNQNELLDEVAAVLSTVVSPG